jgi:hypothetical protein
MFNGLTIFALGGLACVDVTGAGTAAGTLVQLFPCNGTVAQQWEYFDGLIFNPHSAKCLDAVDLANGRQLIINVCTTVSLSQNWQIK